MNTGSPLRESGLYRTIFHEVLISWVQKKIRLKVFQEKGELCALYKLLRL